MRPPVCEPINEFFKARPSRLREGRGGPTLSTWGETLSERGEWGGRLLPAFHMGRGGSEGGFSWHQPGPRAPTAAS